MSLEHLGNHTSPSTEFKKGQHISPSTEFKRGDSRTIMIAKNSGRASVESGRIFNAPKYSFITHNNHFHRSNAELNYHEYLKTIYNSNLIHCNIRLKCVEIDFVISSNINSFNLWSKVIEYHPYDRDMSLEQYKQERINKLRSLGITCPIEVIFRLPPLLYMMKDLA